MKYMFLIYSAEAHRNEPAPDSPEFAAHMAPWIEYTQAMREAGVMVDGEPLQPTSTATTVTMADGQAEPVFTDGPFAETKEQLGGFYMVDCKDLDEAMSWAAKCPGVHTGRIEVRPVAVFG